METTRTAEVVAEPDEMAIDPSGVGRLPDFAIIGSAKAATNTLRHHLMKHPKLFVMPSEPSFYTVFWERGFDWYRSLQEGASDDQLIGDCSTQYTFAPWAEKSARRIARFRPDTKLIYMMREPVSRAFSQYLFLQETWFDPGKPVDISFEEAAERHRTIVESSDYLNIIKIYHRYFPPENLLCLLTEDLTADPDRVVRRALRFLGVDDSIDLQLDRELKANTRSNRVESYLRTHLLGPITRPRPVRALVEALPEPVRVAAREAIYGILRRSPLGRNLKSAYQPKPMLPETRERLIERYSATFDELAELTGNDLSPWKQ